MFRRTQHTQTGQTFGTEDVCIPFQLTDSLGGSRASSNSGLKKLGGPEFESPSARSLEHVIVSVFKGRADELSTLMRTNAQGGKYLHSDTADKNERLKLKRSSRFRRTRQLQAGQLNTELE